MHGRIRVRSIAEAETHITSHQARLDEIERLVRDHAQRFDTLQTPLWKRLLFKLNGWPFYDLNAPAPKPRPWHRRIRP